LQFLKEKPGLYTVKKLNKKKAEEKRRYSRLPVKPAGKLVVVKKKTTLPTAEGVQNLFYGGEAWVAPAKKKVFQSRLERRKIFAIC